MRWRIAKDLDATIRLQECSVVITGDLIEDRHRFLPENAHNAESVFNCHYDHNTMSFTINGKPHDDDPLRSASQFIDNSIDLTGRIALDATALDFPSLVILLLTIHKKGHNGLDIYYVEPEKYKKMDAFGSKYDLSDRIGGIQSIPGFTRQYDPDLKQDLVVFLGFEGSRVFEIIEELETSNLAGITPVIPLPSHKAGWFNITIQQNIDTLINRDSRAKLKRISANDPFSVYNFLMDRQKKYHATSQLVVAPLGTKPHSLGVIIFGIYSLSSVILFDFPVIKNRRAMGIGGINSYRLDGIIGRNN